MRTFKTYLEEKSKKKKNKPLETTISRGHEFGMVGAGRSGLMQTDKKRFKVKKQRKEGKNIARKAMRGDY